MEKRKTQEFAKFLKVTPVPKKENTLPPICPCCKEGVMVTIVVFGSRGPPEHFLSLAQEPKLSMLISDGQIIHFNIILRLSYIF